MPKGRSKAGAEGQLSKIEQLHNTRRPGVRSPQHGDVIRKYSGQLVTKLASLGVRHVG